MANRVRVIVLGLLLVAAPAAAADVDRRWSGMVESPMGPVPITFVFKADGDTLTGQMILADFGDIKLDSGKVEGDKISFVANMDFGGMAFQMTFKGVVSGAEIKLDLDIMGMPMALVVKKAN